MSSILGALVLSCLAGWVASCSAAFMALVLGLFLLNRQISESWSLLEHMSGVSALLVFLSGAVCFLAILCSEEREFSYSQCLLILTCFLMLAFSMASLIHFYVFFEACLIPTLLLIVSWGYQPERLQAGVYMIMYTVAASLPMLSVVLWRCSHSGTSWSLLMNEHTFASLAVLFAVFGAFLVKIPIYTLHLWLPKAHVEAPLAGSMFLAGVLLKLGGFGMLKMNQAFIFGGSSCTLIVVVALWGGLLASLMCLRQTDMKALVAYSSVGHMAVVVSGCVMDSSWGVSSSTVTMFAHGLSSPALFLLAYITYQKANSRSITHVGGVLVAYPWLSLGWFVYCCVNMSAPPSLNLIGELLIGPALYLASWWALVVLGLLVFVSAAYNMYLYTSLNHGSWSFHMGAGSPMKDSHMVGVLAHSLPLLLLFKSELLVLF